MIPAVEHADGLPRYDAEYWAPAAALADCVSGYSWHDVSLAPDQLHRDLLFPGWFNLRILTRGTLFLIDGADMPPTTLTGPASRAQHVTTGSGTLVAAGLTPLGWYRLSRTAASDYADRVVPAREALAGADALGDAVRAAHGAAAIRAALDDWFALRLRPRAGEDRVVAINALLLADELPTVTEAAERLEMSPRSFHKLCTAAFGFGPKLLLRRARFLRTLQMLREPSPEPWSTRIDASYFDQSHFIRDCHFFLRMAPGDFLHHIHPLNETSARLRARVLGAPMQALHRSISPR